MSHQVDAGKQTLEDTEDQQVHLITQLLPFEKVSQMALSSLLVENDLELQSSCLYLQILGFQAYNPIVTPHKIHTVLGTTSMPGKYSNNWVQVTSQGLEQSSNL